MSPPVTTLAERVVARGMNAGVPLAVHVDLTMRCNERCVHCYRVVEDRVELGTDEVRALLRDLARAGTLYLTLSGGEIFLRPDLLAVIAHAKRLRFDVRLKTNALLVTRARAEALRDLGVRQVDVSVYSAQARVHDRVTGIPGSLARTLAGVARLSDAGVGVTLRCPLMTLNADGHRALSALAEGLGVHVGFDPMITTRNDGDRAPVAFRPERRQLRALFADRTLGPDPAAVSRESPDPLDDVPCGAGHTACYVSAYGDVMPCVAMPIACGNVRERSFVDIWRDSPDLARVRAVRVRHLHTCAACPATSFCSRCPGQALVEDGDLLGPSLAACEQASDAASVARVAAVPAPIRWVGAQS